MIEFLSAMTDPGCTRRVKQQESLSMVKVESHMKWEPNNSKGYKFLPYQDLMFIKLCLQ